MSIFSAIVLLFLVMDPMGNIPFFLTTLKEVDPQRRKRVMVRELLIALLALILFLFAGQFVLQLLQISEPSLTIAGGIILFLIAIKMVFPTAERTYERSLGGEPFIVPLAIPYVAGPSALSAVLFIMSRDAARWPEWLIAIIVAWLLSGAILMTAHDLSKHLGERGLIAIERLMGMILITIAVQMTMTGMSHFLALGVPK
jgi:multiple antibiotic resistance protein